MQKQIIISIAVFLLLIIYSCSKDNEDYQDSFFTYKYYEDFIAKLANTDSIICVPLKDFNATVDKDKIIIGLRHDIDHDINGAIEMANIEHKYNISASYYVLHTAKYYLINEDIKSLRDNTVLAYLKKIQNTYDHEIGFHNDLITIQIVYNINSKEFLHKELNWLRENGIEVLGTASHGSDYCYEYKYLNYFFFTECDADNSNPSFENNEYVIVNGIRKDFLKGSFEEYQLEYEANFLTKSRTYADCNYINGEQWNPKMIDYNTWKKGDRIIILTHPVYWK